MAKTIKQLADEIGVSKTAINKKIANLGLQESLQKDKNRILIDEKAESTIKSAFNISQSKTRKPKTEDEIENEIAYLKDIVRRNDEYIEELRSEKEKLMKQIEENMQALFSMQDLLKAEMMLRGQAENRVLLLEEKIATSEKKETFLDKLKKILKN